MKLRYTVPIVLCVFFFSLFGLNYALGAPSLSIQTDKPVYEYGDHLSLIFDVSEITGDSITIQIIDDSGNASSTISIPITSLKTEITAHDVFDKIRFKPGTYHIDAIYSGTNSSTIFTLTNSDKVAIPSQYKTLVKLWSDSKQLTDIKFSSVIRDLIQYEIIQIPEFDNQTNAVHIPSWVKNDAKWWSDDLISDNDFGLAIQYLIKAKIMTV